MPQTMTQYTVFIGSRVGLDDERRELSSVLRSLSWRLVDKGIGFRSLGRQIAAEEGKPLDPRSEDDLRRSDFAVFLVDDRWTSSNEDGRMSALSQQWALAEELYRANKLLGIAVLFKKVDPDRLAAPEDQLKAVIDFRHKVEAEGCYYIGDCASLESFSEAEREDLDDWLRSLTINMDRPAFAGINLDKTNSLRIGAPNAEYWIAEAWANVEGDMRSRNTALYCATNAVKAARGDVEQAKTHNILSIAQFRLGRIDEALATLTAMADKLEDAFGGDRRQWHATVLLNKGLMLEALGRGSDAIAVHDDLVSRFGTAHEQSLRDLVAKALASKARVLDTPKSIDDTRTPDGEAPEFPEREVEAQVLALIEELRGPRT